jgi:rod shape-determining protein MreD
MGGNIIWASVFALIAGILQSTILARLSLYHAVPDLALGILVFSAYNNGVMTGQLTGFVSGLLLDFLSAAPLGLNTFVRTLIGALTGLIQGTFFSGKEILPLVFFPMVLCGGATLFKALILWVLHLLFTEAVPAYSVTSPMLWMEFIFNTLSAPFLFALLGLFKKLLVRGGDL